MSSKVHTTGFLLLALALIAVSLVFGCCPSTPTPTPTLEATPYLTIMVEVRDSQTGEVVEGATVDLEITDMLASRVLTDEDGQAKLLMADSDLGKMYTLTVSAQGYKEWRVTTDTLPRVVSIDLEREAATLPPTSSPVIPTDTPTLSPQASPMDVPTVLPASSPILPTHTATSEPSKVPTPRPKPTSTPSAPLSIKELWPVGTECRLGGHWSADLRVLPEGGSGAYDYYIDGVWKASSGAEGVTIRLDRNACTAIVGTLTVKSGEQIVSQEFWIGVPECCGK